MHSVCLSARLFNSASTPSGALGSDTTAENTHLPGLTASLACAVHVPRVAKRENAVVALRDGICITQMYQVRAAKRSDILRHGPGRGNEICRHRRGFPPFPKAARSLYSSDG